MDHEAESRKLDLAGAEALADLTRDHGGKCPCDDCETLAWYLVNHCARVDRETGRIKR